MGVEYRHYLVPEDRTLASDPATIARVVEMLRGRPWVTTTGGNAFRTFDNPHAPRMLKTAEAAIAVPMPVTAEWIASLTDEASSDPLRAELALAFTVDSGDDPFDETDVAYPFAAGANESGYHDIVIHASQDFIHHMSENTDPIDTLCACGEDLAYDPDPTLRTPWLAIRFESRIRARCPRCEAAFDPSRRGGGRTDGYTGKPLPALAGGGAYRSAIIVDCGKGWPRDCGRIAIHPAFRDACAAALGTPLVDFGEFY
jgi:hypothetical protein